MTDIHHLIDQFAINQVQTIELNTESSALVIQLNLPFHRRDERNQ